MKRRENWFRTIEFRNPQWIPTKLRALPATWKKYRENLESIVDEYPFCRFERTKAGLLTGGFDSFTSNPKNGYDSISPAYQEGFYDDPWGCKWKNPQDGMVGIVLDYPLEDWENLSNYEFPDPRDPGWHGRQNWDQVQEYIDTVKEIGDISIGTLPHGFLFLRVSYLRGFENFMKDFFRNQRHLQQLIERLVEWNIARVEEWGKLNIDILYAGDDLGGQDKLLINPDLFRDYIKPAYKRIFNHAREQGIITYFHSDGHILDVAEDLLECDIDIIQPQVGPNTVDGIADYFKGNICIDLDLDRQLFLLATPEQLKEHIATVVNKLSSKKGGLMLEANVGPEVPLENIRAICEAFAEHRILNR